MVISITSPHHTPKMQLFMPPKVSFHYMSDGGMFIGKDMWAWKMTQWLKKLGSHT